MRKTKLTVIAHGVVILVALIALLFASFESWRGSVAQPEKIRFFGEYSADAVSFQPLNENIALDANRGTVVLRGNFLRGTGEVGLQPEDNLNFFQNHIGVSIYVNGRLLYDADVRQGADPKIDADELCGAAWHSVHVESEIRPEDQVTVYLTNIHSFGNRDAYQEWLNELYLAPETVFEEYQMRKAMPDWIMAGALLVFAVVMLGTALGFAVMGDLFARQLAAFGLLCMFMGGYILFDTRMLAVTSIHLIFRNVGYHVCMMLAAFELCWIMLRYLSGTRRKTAAAMTVILGMTDVLVSLVSLSRSRAFYDVAILWSPVQALCTLVLIGAGLYELIRSRKKVLIPALILQAALLWELVNAGVGWMDSGRTIKPVFLVVFLLFLLRGSRRVISNQIRAVEVERLERQLTENRIATMISQIQPHFIYNTLGTIEQICLDQPEKASELVHNFSMYLRGNFTELDNLSTIRLENEIEHVRYYAEIEKVRFPDMTILFNIQCDSFSLPPLTVQPLVENAIKHGLMGLESEGIVKISAYESKGHYWVRVEDDGVGFDTAVLQDPRKHIGIRNIRARLEAMCDGVLTVESTPGAGTVATVMIPKKRGEKQ